MSAGLAARLQALEDRDAIAEVVVRYCRAIDRCDEVLLRSCFHPDATHRHGGFEGASADFCTLALGLVRALVLTHHQLGPVSIELRGDVAFTETYFTSLHRFGPAPPPGGKPHEDRIARGRYIDRFERRDGAWRIAHRHGVTEWMRYDAGDDRGFFDGPADQRGRRDGSDPVYRR